MTESRRIRRIGSMRDDLRSLRSLMHHLRPQLHLLVPAIGLMMPLFAFSSVAQPYLLKRAIDAALVSRSSAALSQAAYLYLIVMVVAFLARFAQVYLLQLAGQKAIANLRRSVFDHLQRLSLRYFEGTPVGRLVTRVTNDIDSLGEFFSSGAVTAITDILVLVGILIAMFRIDSQLAAIALVVIPILLPVLQVFRRFARRAYQTIRIKVSALNADLSEQVQGLALIKAYGQEEALALEYAENNHAYRAAHYQAIWYDSLLYSVVESVSTAAVALVLWFAAIKLGWLEDSTDNRTYVGIVVAFYEYIQRFFIPLRELSQKFATIQSALASAERIEEVLREQDFDAPVRQDSVGTERTAPGFEDAILVFDGVNFSYDSQTPVLEKLSLRLKQGQRMALVGATGSGKTTVTSLALRLYETEGGGIYLNGRDLRALSRQEIEQHFSVIPQEVFLFSGSLRENLIVGLDDVPSDEQLEDSLVRVDLWSVVQSRGGLESPVEERGRNWSAGERQLVAFARALLRARPLLILDEATASLDAETEARVERATEAVMENATCLIVAHRLATVKKADMILVLERGVIAESGTHGDLLAANGLYRQMWDLQTHRAED